MIERNFINIFVITIGIICSIVLVISGDPFTRLLGLAIAWSMGVATKSIKGN